MSDSMQPASSYPHSTVPSYHHCVVQALRSAPHPLTVEELLAAVSVQRPLTKSARSAIYGAIRKEFLAVPVGSGRYGWLPNLLVGCTFRHSLSRNELAQNVLILDELLTLVFAPLPYGDHQTVSREVLLELTGGDATLARVMSRGRRRFLNFDDRLGRWVDQAGCQAGDDLIIGVIDGAQGRYAMRLQPRELRDRQAVESRNHQVGLAARTILQGDRRHRPAMPVLEIAAQLIARGGYRDPVPPGNLRKLLTEHSALIPMGDDAYSLTPDSSTVRPDPDRSRPAVDWLYSSDLASEWTETGMLPPHFRPAREGWRPVEDFEDDPQMEADLESDLDDMSDEPCEDYVAYLDIFRQMGQEGEPLNHTDYHLLEAELDMLIGLEYEFGYLHPEQLSRRQELADRLFIDLDALLGDEDQWDQDYPPF